MIPKSWQTFRTRSCDQTKREHDPEKLADFFGQGHAGKAELIPKKVADFTGKIVRENKEKARELVQAEAIAR